jgi:hypothetical protein
VTSKLLTGFDAPILQAMYLDKPMRDHTLLQAICRTNRPYGESKTHGLIVDYLGVFDDVAQAIQLDEEGITRVVANINELKSKLLEAVQNCLAYFPGVDRTVTGYDGLIAAQDCLPNNDVRDRFARDYSYLSRLWEAISPDSALTPHETDYRWLSQVYDSVKPSGGGGRLLWHALGAKTIELIHWMWATPTWAALSPEVSGNIAAEASDKGKAASERATESRLRSIKEIEGYTLTTPDGELGHLEDLLFDGDWRIRYAVADTRNWLPGKSVLLPINCIEAIRWSERSLHVWPSRKLIREAPPYDPHRVVTKADADALQVHYGACLSVKAESAISNTN